MFVRSSVDMSALVTDGTLSGELIESQVRCRKSSFPGGMFACSHPSLC